MNVEQNTESPCDNKDTIKPSQQTINLIIGLFFDGTGNNVDNINIHNNNAETDPLYSAQDEDKDILPTDVLSFLQKCQELSQNSGSYLEVYTNIHWLNTLYIQDSELTKSQDNYQRKIYISGVGTRSGKADILISSALGVGKEGIVDKTDQAIQQVQQELQQCQAEYGNCVVNEVIFDIFGFSRGAAAARHYANRVYQQDPAIVNAITQGLGYSLAGKAAGKIRFIGLFDTVAAVGDKRNHFDVHGSSNPGVELALPADIAEHVFQISAQNECRYNFSLNSVQGHWPELPLPGSHSDIGGGYESEEEEHLFVTRPAFETMLKVVPDQNSKIYRQAEKDQAQLWQYPNLVPMLENGQLNIEVWKSTLPLSEGALHKRIGVGVSLNRQVQGDWFKVALRVMVSAAQDAGVNVNAIADDDERFTLPSELQPLAQKALEQGHALRTGERVIPFSDDEIKVIGRYMHCSSNWNGFIVKNVLPDGTPQPNIDDGSLKLTHHTVLNQLKDIRFVNRPNKDWQRAVWSMEESE